MLTSIAILEPLATVLQHYHTPQSPLQSFKTSCCCQMQQTSLITSRTPYHKQLTNQRPRYKLAGNRRLKTSTISLACDFKKSFPFHFVSRSLIGCCIWGTVSHSSQGFPNHIAIPKSLRKRLGTRGSATRVLQQWVCCKQMRWGSLITGWDVAGGCCKHVAGWVYDGLYNEWAYLCNYCSGNLSRFFSMYFLF